MNLCLLFICFYFVSTNSWNPCKYSAPSNVECAEVYVPLDWEKPNEKQMSFEVVKVKASTKQKKGSVWFLNGGTGMGGMQYDLNLAC